MTRYLLIIALLVNLVAPALADSSDHYFSCRSCHGDAAQGYEAKNAPALAGQSADYLARQLENFKTAKRGAHEADIWGAQMVLMAVSIELSNVRELSEYIASLPPWRNVSADPVADPELQQAFAPCAACHGSKGEGNPAFNAPRIAGLDAVYLARQLRNFRDGIRGAAPGDLYGNQMRAAMPSNWEDNTIGRMADFISGL